MVRGGEEGDGMMCTWFSVQATTTPLVRNIFELFFKNQIDGKPTTSAPKRKRCGVCEVCVLCGVCEA